MQNIHWYCKTPRIRQASSALHDGAVIAYPTEGVWGLGCDPYNAEAVFHLLRLKDRPVEKGLILIADSLNTARSCIPDVPDLPKLRQPTTWLIEHQGRVPYWVSGDSNKVALRIIHHPLVAALCKTFKGPIVSTSANPAGAAPARSARQVSRYFGDALDVILPGSLGNAAGPSQIIDWASGEIVRAKKV